MPTAKQKLERALMYMKDAERLIEEAKQENQSLEEEFGYSLEIIIQELNRFSDNSRGYQGNNASLEEIIEDEATNWEDNE